MANKRYYWLKFKEDFFKQREIKKLRKIAGGDTYTIIYLKMQLLAIKNEGWIYFEGTEKNILEQLELEIDEDVDNIEVTVKFLQANNLIEVNNNHDCFLFETSESIGSETQSTRRSRKAREKNKALQCNTNATNMQHIKLQCNTNATNCNTEKEKEKEIEIEKDEEEKNFSSSSNNLKIIFNFYQENIGIISPFICEEIESFVNDGIEPAMINECIKQACLQNVKTWAYVKGVINKSLLKNIKTVEQFNANEIEYQNNKTKTNTKITTKNSGYESNCEQRPISTGEYDKYIFDITKIL